MRRKEPELIVAGRRLMKYRFCNWYTLDTRLEFVEANVLTYLYKKNNLAFLLINL